MEWSKPEVTGDVPEPREGHCAHLVQQSLYIYGGSTHTPMDLHDMHVLDLGECGSRGPRTPRLLPPLNTT